MIIRKAEAKDIDIIINLRQQLLTEEGLNVPVDITSQLRQYFDEQLNETFNTFLAEIDGEVVSMFGVIFQQYPPSFSNKSGIRAYITDVYTLPQYRKQGIASQLLNKTMQFIASCGVTYVWLWATPDGSKLYSRCGFNVLTDFTTMESVIKL